VTRLREREGEVMAAQPRKGESTLTKTHRNGPLLRIEGLRTTFDTPAGTAHVVNGVDIEARAGEIVGIVGESGCGKSVTVRSILGLVRPPGQVVGGSVVFDERELIGMRRKSLQQLRGKEIGFIAQNPFSALNPVLPIHRQFKNIILAHEGPRALGARDRSRKALAAVGIAGPDRVLDGYAHQLSGGMAQRVVIAMAMLLNPKLVVADEPTTGLDLTVQRQILDLIQKLVRSGDRSMLLVTHDLGVIAQYCDRVVVMYAGKVVEQGQVSDVLTAPAHPYTKALLEAVPRPSQPLVHLSGQLPDLVNYPRGCPFVSRCSMAHEPCAHIPPSNETAWSGQNYTCHLPEGATPRHAHTRT
jgi:peptide/nickel transport system ATP-binding protein